MAESFPVIPEDLEPSHRGFLEGRSDIRLAYCRWEHPAPKGRVVLLHGYGEHGERYRHTAHWLKGLGWSVSAMDQRGFGRSGGPRGDAEGIRPFVDDLAFFLRHERHHDASQNGAPPRVVDGVPLPPHPHHPQILLGHSFGGLVSLLDLLWHSDTLDGLICSAPAVAQRPLSLPMRGVRALLRTFAPHRILEHPNDKSQVCSDPVLVQRYWADPLCHRFVSAAFLEAISEGQRELHAFGPELDRPVLLLEAPEDTVTDPRAAQAFWDTVRPDLLERHLLPGFRHEIFHDQRRREAQQLAADWLGRRLQDWPRNSTDHSDTLAR